MRRPFAVLALLATAIVPGAGPALAQAGGTPCVLDKCLGAAGPAPSPAQPPDADGGVTRRVPPASGAFDFYVLALSWSPGFCDSAGASRASAQCTEGRRLGFVVHGLWPQNTRGYPSNCDGGSRFPTRAAVESVLDLYPDAGLVRHEWRMHGTCTGLSPTDYFATVRQARSRVTVPPDLAAPAEPRTVAPVDITRAFLDSNPGLRPDAVAVTCRSEELAEVRICLSKDLRGFVSCPEITRAGCHTRSITVLPAH